MSNSRLTSVARGGDEVNGEPLPGSTTLLERARIVHRITGTHGNGIPIGGDINPKQNKFLLLDIGLYLCEAKLDVSNWILDPGAKFVNRGKMAEMFVALEILKNASPYDDAKLFYWHKESQNSNAEVDHVVQYRNRILPIEVKLNSPVEILGEYGI